MQQGYKQTDIGIIPKDWDCVKIEDVATISMCKRIFADQTTENGEIPFYKIGTFGKETDAYISVALYNEYKNKFSFPKQGDVLISAAGTLGRTVVYDGKDAYFQDSNIVWLDIDKNVLCNEYLNHYYRVIKWASSEGSTIARLYNGIIYATNIALPPLEEQKRIAEALSDVDSMISSLEKLIAKKKAVKQGAMQELLTGKKRLPGFTGNIEYKPLSSLCTLFADGDWIESKDQSNDGIRLIQTGNIGVGKYLDKTDKQRFISTETFDRLKCLEIFENDVIVSRLPEPAGRACILPYFNKRRITAVDCTIIRFADYNPELFVAYSQTKQYQDKVDMAMAGSTRQRISRKELGEIPIPVFPTLKEQNAVASIFSDMDNEIEALEQKLEKTRQVKQGMMQQLLTGKIRLA